ncbi:MAG: CaiB/BaiF CoA transferase family protein [Dehalococcoidia bacterium]
MAQGPLEGIRVVDLTRVWTGPYWTKILGDLGAEVIKIEAPFRPDSRLLPFYWVDNDPGQDAVASNRNGVFHKNNRSKLGLTLDLDQDEGKELFRRLVAISHVVVENHSPRVMTNWGLDYEALRLVKPDIIMCSIPAYGMTGPRRDWLAYGTTLDCHCGLASIMGYAGGPPQRFGFAVGDPIGGMFATTAILAALHRQAEAGQGQYIDVAQAEAIPHFIGEAFLEWSMNRRTPPRLGNRDRTLVPQGCYRCRGNDAWLVVSVRNDDDWRALCRGIGRPRLADDPRFATAPQRRRHQDEIDTVIAAWARRRNPRQAMQTLQRAGVPASMVFDSRDLVLDPHLRARGYFEVVPGDGWARPHHGQSFRLSKTPGRIRRRAPAFGEHNDYAFGELLGLSAEEIARLEEKRVISRTPTVPPAAPPAPQPLDRYQRIGLVSEVDPRYLERLRQAYGQRVF